jgi:hypothetical protein
MIAYRAETAMAQIVRQKITRHGDARSLLRGVYNTEVDIAPDLQAKTLTIRLHPLANKVLEIYTRSGGLHLPGSMRSASWRLRPACRSFSWNGAALFPS